jgi:hypothetical protein
MADFALGQGCRTFASDRGSASSGVTVTSSGTSDTMGSWAEMDASTEEEAVGLKISIPRVAVVGSNTISYLVNIGIGPATEQILIEHLHFGQDNTETNQNLFYYDVPVSIPKGSRITAQCQSNTTDADSINVLAEFIVGSFKSNPGNGGVISYGSNSATSNGTEIDPGGSANTLGAWTELTASSAELRGFFLSIGMNARTSVATDNTIFEVGIGSSGNEEIIAEGIVFKKGTFETSMGDTSFRRVAIPVGARIVVRSQCDNPSAGTRVTSVVFHGVK